MGKDINFKEFNLNDIEWNKIKGGLSKDELCKGNKKLECIFDAINKDKISDKLSNVEIQEFANTLFEYSKDEILDKKEAHNFKNSKGKKTNYKDVFAFLMELKKHESKDCNLITTYTTTIDGEDVEVAEYTENRVEYTAVDGSWSKSVETEETPAGKVEREYQDGNLFRVITRQGTYTEIRDVQKNITTEIYDIGNGLQEKVETKALSDGLAIVTKTRADNTQTSDYKGRLYIYENSKSVYIEMGTIQEYISGEYPYNISDSVISLIKNSQMDSESQKKYISGIVNRIIGNANVLADYSSKELKEELDKYVNGETSDVSKIQTLYKQAVEALRVIKYDSCNGLIDKDFEQGDAGDCYLLAAIKSLSMNKNTAKIINDCVKIDKDGNAKVTLKGVNKTFTVTQAELESDNYSSGDKDVKAIEIAVERYIKKYGNPFDIGDHTLDAGTEKMRILF